MRNASNLASSTTTTTLRSGPERSGPDVGVVVDKLAASLPPEFQPPRLCRRYLTEAELLAVLEDEKGPFGMPLPDAINLVHDYGPAACEGALMRTIGQLASKEKPRKPRGLLIWFLRSGKAWTSAQVEGYVRREWEKGLEKLAASDSPTHKRLARDLDLMLERGPENVRALREVGR